MTTKSFHSIIKPHLILNYISSFLKWYVELRVPLSEYKEETL